MPSFCVVSNCELKYSHSENVSFHKFPLNNPSVLTEWIKFTDRGTDWQPSRWSSICSRHFLSTDFRDYLSRKCLKKTAIPSLVTKNNISYETYHIANSTSNSNCLDEDEDIVIAEYNSPNQMKNVISNVEQQSSVAHNKHPVATILYCRLCGDRIEDGSLSTHSINNHEISLMLRKCLPTVNIHPDVDLLNSVCNLCVSNLRVYSDFVEKVLAYQIDFGLGAHQTHDPVLRNNIIGTICEPKLQISNSSGSAIFIKQEPINVKQEILEISNKKPFDMSTGSTIYNAPKTSSTIATECANTDLNCIPETVLPRLASDMQRIKVVEQEIHWPRTGSNTFCQHCERIFISNFELKTHTCTGQQIKGGDRDTTSHLNNNCEIMEIITLNNPISFIDLAEDEYGSVEPRVFKKEISNDLERRYYVDIEHAYAKRSTVPCNLKQEIELNYDSEEILETTPPSKIIEMSENIAIPNRIENQDVFMCGKCCKEFATITLLEEHTIKLHSLKNKICTICLAEFKSIYEYLLHKNNVHSTGYQCVQCKRKFSSRVSLKNHERYSCKNDSKDFNYSCRHCNKRIRNRMKMKEHLQNCTGNRQKKRSSAENNEKFISCNTDEVITPTNKIIKKYDCELCCRSYKRESFFVRHQATRHAINVKSAPYEVSITNQSIDKLVEVIKNRQEYENTNLISQSAKTSTPSAPKLLTNRRFVCEACGKPFPSYPSLRQHKTTHESERKFICSLCPKTFKRVSGLNQHVRGFHYQIKPFNCPVCNYSYALKGDMLRCRHSSIKK